MNEEQKEKLASVIRSINAAVEHLALVMAVLNTARVDLAEIAVAQQIIHSPESDTIEVALRAALQFCADAEARDG